jgi:hypothetical protein
MHHYVGKNLVTTLFSLDNVQNDSRTAMVSQKPIVDGIVQGLREIRQGQSIKITAMDIFNED